MQYLCLRASFMMARSFDCQFFKMKKVIHFRNCHPCCYHSSWQTSYCISQIFVLGMPTFQIFCLVWRCCILRSAKWWINVGGRSQTTIWLIWLRRWYSIVISYFFDLYPRAITTHSLVSLLFIFRYDLIWTKRCCPAQKSWHRMFWTRQPSIATLSEYFRFSKDSQFYFSSCRVLCDNHRFQSMFRVSFFASCHCCGEVFGSVSLSSVLAWFVIKYIQPWFLSYFRRQAVRVLPRRSYKHITKMFKKQRIRWIEMPSYQTNDHALVTSSSLPPYRSKFLNFAICFISNC